MMLAQMYMQPGRKWLVELQSEATQSDSAGQQSTTWTSYITVWATIDVLQGNEIFKGQQYNTQVTHKVTIRYLPGVTAKQRVQFGTRQFVIEAVENPEEMNVCLVLMCAEYDEGRQVPG